MLKTLLNLALCFITISLSAQSDPNLILSKTAASEDLMILKRALYEIHPSTFRYTSRSRFDHQFDSVLKTLPERITLREFTCSVAPLVAHVRCGHTFLSVPYIGEATRAIPFDIRIIDGKFFIEKNLSGVSEATPGSEILSINEWSSKTLLTFLRNNEGADGFNINTKDRRIERGFKWQYAMYIGQPDSFRITITRYPDGMEKHLTIPSLIDQQIQQNRRDATPRVKPYEFRIDQQKDVAFLRISTFMAKRVRKTEGQNLRKIVDDGFNEIRKQKIDHLVIDLRGNTGGMTFVPPYLYSHLVAEDFKFKDKLVFRHGYRFREPQYLNRSKANDWINRKLMKKVNDSTFEWTLHNNTKRLYHGQKHPFSGKVYVLVDGMTGSGAGEFTTLVHHFRRGLIVGEESGGDYNGVTAYDRTYLRLPHSGLGVFIAGYRSIMPWNEQQYDGHGVPVDYEVKPQIEDLLRGGDPQLAYVLKLIEQSK